MNLNALRAAPVLGAPFPHMLAASVVQHPALEMLAEAFPPIARPGVFPLSALRYRQAFARLVEEIGGRELETILEQKFGVTLSDKTLMITVRGQCQRRDGRIHTDSKDKFLTCLLYLNATGWDPRGGRLRLLRGPDRLDDMIAEIPPVGGNFAAFLRTDQSWHGHEPYEGPRRIVMFNWLVSRTAYVKHIGRHKVSAAFKQVAHAA